MTSNGLLWHGLTTVAGVWWSQPPSYLDKPPPSKIIAVLQKSLPPREFCHFRCTEGMHHNELPDLAPTSVAFRGGLVAHLGASAWKRLKVGGATCARCRVGRGKEAGQYVPLWVDRVGESGDEGRQDARAIT